MGGEVPRIDLLGRVAQLARRCAPAEKAVPGPSR
jgi:hypothetical protein